MRGRGDHGRRWYLFDDLGSVLAEVSPTGTITSSRNYDVYGNVRSGVNANGTSAHKFVGNLGHPSDNNTGLIYMQARYMDPATGRFVSEDPGQRGDNFYVYVRNNPSSSVDANGKDPSTLFQIFVMIYNWISMGYVGQALGELIYDLDCKSNGALTKYLIRKYGESGMSN